MKKWIKTIVVVFICLLFLTCGVGYVWFQHILGKGLPQTSGEVKFRELKNDVEILRDTYGIPHIYAVNEEDLMFAVGYAMAQDRMWQMEFHRRLGHGRLAEIFGSEFVSVDKYFRTISAAGVDHGLSPELSTMFRSFSEGVNSYLKRHRDDLPPEFILLGYEPEPWGPKDYTAILKVIAWGLSSGWKVDLTAAGILEKVGERKMREAFPVWPEGAPLIIPREIKAYNAPPNTVSNITCKPPSLLEELIGVPCPGASNNWVVSGDRSVTGSPLLANDTHLPLSNPSFWWEAHLHCPTLNVAGFAVPGFPGIAIGHNQHVAWGITNVMVDDVDFYIEKVNPRNPREYLYNGRWEKMEVIRETIQVKDDDPVTIEILLTRHGPVISGVEEGPEGKVISARWTFTEALQPGKAAYLLAKARDVGEIKEALRFWELPGQNFVFADKKGNIGYWCCASVPVRQKGDGILPVPGWKGEWEWQGYVPFDKRPHIINPGEGLIATANNKVAGEDYPYLISHYWEPSDRITRIRAFLSEKGRLSVEDFKTLQGDVYCPFAAEFTPEMLRVFEGRFSGGRAKEAIDVLSAWDFAMDKDSTAASIFETAYLKMMSNTFKDEMGEELFKEYLKTTSFPLRALRKMVREGSSPWFDNIRTPERESMDDIIELSLRQTIGELEDRLGNEMGDWRWGRIHRLTYDHVMGKRKPLDLVFNIGPFEVGGNHLSVNKRQYPYERPFDPEHGVSQRMIVDLSNMDHSLHVLPTGESGHLKSPHYKDQMGFYLDSKYHEAWISRGSVEKHRKATLILRAEIDREAK